MQTIKRPTDETIQQIDFVIQGLENGKYKELAKEVEFHQKLKGEDAPDFLYSLFHALEEAQIEIIKLQHLTTEQDKAINDFRNRISDLEVAKQTNDIDIQEIGKGIKYAIDPAPLEKGYELNQFGNWLGNKGIY